MAQQYRGTHALVIGGSFAGLLAARVLADHYRRVTILERDTFPSGGEQRKGVPQGRHTHGLLASGCCVLERWFPGLSQELIETGAVPGDICAHARWFNEGASLVRFKSGFEGLLMTRPFLEGEMRRRVLALPNVEARPNFRAIGLTASREGQRVTGAKGAGAEIAADLVVDASGRGSHSPEWLAALGYPKPEEQRVEIALTYTTRLFRRRHEQLDGDLAALILPTPNGKRGGAMLAQEADRWMVTLAGHFGQEAPQELDGFIEFSRTLPAPYIYDVIKDAEPVSEPELMRFPASRRRRYDKLDRFRKATSCSVTRSPVSIRSMRRACRQRRWNPRRWRPLSPKALPISRDAFSIARPKSWTWRGRSRSAATCAWPRRSARATPLSIS